MITEEDKRGIDPTFQFNFYAPVGQNIARVEHMEVHFDKDMSMQVVDTGDCSVSEKSDVSAALRTPAAEKYWQGLRKAGFVDADCRLLPSTTRKQAMYIADVFADKLGLQAKWKLFQELWGVKNLAQEKWDCQQTGTLPSRNKDIDAIFKD